MPGRLIPLVEGQIYHVFNRGIDHRLTFSDRLELKRAVAVIDHYRFTKPLLRFSKFIKLSPEERIKFKSNMSASSRLVDILCFCLMPNHFHFLLRQVCENGISKFLSNFQNSYTRYFNTKNKRDGPLFLDQFKAILIETEEQLVHVSRYIHLNPTTSYIVKNFESLLDYSWSSLSEYVEGKELLCETKTVLSYFKSRKAYTDFLKNQVDYQRELHKIEKLILE